MRLIACFGVGYLETPALDPIAGLYTSTLLKNTDYITGQINHVVNKLGQAKRHLGRTSFRPLLALDRKQDDILAKAAKDSNKNNIYFWIDPTRTISAGKVNIGAFRTYAEGYKAENEMIDYQAIPLDKAQDFGVHYKKYYPLEASFFKSSLDKRLLEHLWNRYWVSTLR
ncbi:unnamed protein product [Rotaria sp. Silwood1]|nr:unnamed protein product [Rotaria sp. Silwood1]